MCKHRNSRRVDLYRPDDEGKLRFFKQVRLDACLADSNLVQSLNESGIKTLGSCCGHGKYHMSIISNLPMARYAIGFPARKYSGKRCFM